MKTLTPFLLETVDCTSFIEVMAEWVWLSFAWGRCSILLCVCLVNDYFVCLVNDYCPYIQCNQPISRLSKQQSTKLHDETTSKEFLHILWVYYKQHQCDVFCIIITLVGILVSPFSNSDNCEIQWFSLPHFRTGLSRFIWPGKGPTMYLVGSR